MTPGDAVKALDAIDGGDPEVAHDRADAILMEVLPPNVVRAYERLKDRCDWWATA